MFTLAECAHLLAELPCREILFVRGNHEDHIWWEFAEAWTRTGRSLNALHGETSIAGPLLVVGFPCAMGEETAFLGAREPLPQDPNAWLSRLLRKHGPGMRTLWLMHETPTGTPLSQGGSPVGGNSDWNSAIERFSPWLTISGHDHQTPLANKCWHHRISQTVCVNAGQADLAHCITAWSRRSSRGPAFPCQPSSGSLLIPGENPSFYHRRQNSSRYEHHMEPQNLHVPANYVPTALLNMATAATRI